MRYLSQVSKLSSVFDVSLPCTSTDYTSVTTARYLYVLKCLQFPILACLPKG